MPPTCWAWTALRTQRGQGPGPRARRGGWTRVPGRGCRARRKPTARRCAARPPSAIAIFSTRRSRRSCRPRLCIFPAPRRDPRAMLCGGGALAQARPVGQNLRRASPPTFSPRRAIYAASPSPGPPPQVIPRGPRAARLCCCFQTVEMTRGPLMCPYTGHRDRFAVSRGAPGPGAYTPVGFANPSNHPTPPRKFYAFASWSLLPAALGMRRGAVCATARAVCGRRRGARLARQARVHRRRDGCAGGWVGGCC